MHLTCGRWLFDQKSKKNHDFLDFLHGPFGNDLQFTIIKLSEQNTGDEKSLGLKYFPCIQ